jgi:hypothetical protein
MAATDGPSPRALRVADGLTRTGRAYAPRTEKGFLMLEATTGGRYRVTYDGRQVFRHRGGPADQLQDGFVVAMERAGTS